MKINKKIDNVYHIEFGLDDDRANARIYRYDTGQLIKFYDIPDDVEVQFSNEHSTNGTINKRITDSMVQIPDSLLTSKDNIIAYIKYIDENSETTTKLIKFGLLDRAKPSDYVSPDEEPSFRSFVEEQLKEAKETVEKNKDYLKETIENTEKSKEYMDATDANRRTVEGLTEKNKEYATQTESNAESANTSASNASESASNASQSASNAKGSADNASVSAKEAKNAAVKAGTSESNAKEAESNINSAVTEFEQTKRESLTEIGNLTTNSKKEISDLTDAKKTELNKINDDITQNAGELKEAIVNAADTKKEEINQKGLEVLQSIPEEFSKVEDTTLIKPTESGTEMMLTDSSDMNIQELHIYGRTEQASTTGVNLFDVNDRLSFNSIFKVDEEGYITATIPANNTENEQYYNFFTKKSDLLKIDTEYLIVTEILEIPTEKCQLNIITLEQISKGQFANAVGKTMKGIKFDKAKTKNDMSDCIAMMRGFMLTKPGFTGGKIKFRVSVLEDTTITANTFKYEPYTGGQPSPNPDYPQEMNCVENPTVSVAGKNLLVNNAKSKQIRNLIYTVNEDKSISVKGTYEVGKDVTESDIYLFGTFNDEGQYVYIPKGRYSINTISVPNGTYIAREKTKGSIINSENIIKTLSEQDCYFYSWVFRITKDGTYNSTIYPQMEVGNTATEYEPYKEIQSAQQTCELSGIGDVKDELIVRADGTGQLVQKIKSYDCSQISRNLQQSPNKEYYYLPAIDKSTTNASRVLSTHFTSKTFDKKWGNVFKVNGNFYFGEKEAPDNISDKNAMKQWLIGNKVKILFQLEEPIVTELSSEEVQKILALHTNKPNTTIWNDQDAEMQVTYVADTKSYIDKKFKELSDAIVASASEAE